MLLVLLKLHLPYYTFLVKVTGVRDRRRLSWTRLLLSGGGSSHCGVDDAFVLRLHFLLPGRRTAVGTATCAITTLTQPTKMSNLNKGHLK